GVDSIAARLGAPSPFSGSVRSSAISSRSGIGPRLSDAEAAAGMGRTAHLRERDDPSRLTFRGSLEKWKAVSLRLGARGGPSATVALSRRPRWRAANAA